MPLLIAEKEGSAGVPILPVLYMNLCTMLLSLKHTEEAEEIFDKAYKLVLKFPENSPVWAAISWADESFGTQKTCDARNAG